MMKKFFLFLALALTLSACNQQNSKTSQQTEEKKEIASAQTPKAPKQALSTNHDTVTTNSQTPLLQLEEGKPLDLSQLMHHERKSFGEQAAERIDTIRYQAEQGNSDYQYLYAVCLENGWGIEENPKLAATWYKKATDQQQKYAYNALGNLYRNGKGVKQNDGEAFKWFKLGAEANDAQAMLNLGNCHYFGMGTEKNLDEAVKWWQKSAEGGNAHAEAQVGDCYFYGIGVEKNLDKAIDYFTRAANKNVAGAQYRLGILYYSGQGVKQDLAYSKLLMNKARDGGMKEAQEFLDKQFK